MHYVKYTCTNLTGGSLLLMELTIFLHFWHAVGFLNEWMKNVWGTWGLELMALSIHRGRPDHVAPPPGVGGDRPVSAQ